MSPARGRPSRAAAPARQSGWLPLRLAPRLGVFVMADSSEYPCPGGTTENSRGQASRRARPPDAQADGFWALEGRGKNGAGPDPTARRRVSPAPLQGAGPFWVSCPGAALAEGELAPGYSPGSLREQSIYESQVGVAADASLAPDSRSATTLVNRRLLSPRLKSHIVLVPQRGRRRTVRARGNQSRAATPR